MAYNSHGKRIRSENLAGQVTTTAWYDWFVTYNGENRPILWSNGSTNIVMSFDRMGRRVTKNNQRFVYDGYLQIADSELQTPNSRLQTFIWDPTEPIATRPLAWLVLRSLGEGGYYTHDGNKNVSEVVAYDRSLAAHYEYASFGIVTVSFGISAAFNPWRFSSEFAEDDTSTVYYNYRHYDAVMGSWMSRDPIEVSVGVRLYSYVLNKVTWHVDIIGLWLSSAHEELTDKAYPFHNEYPGRCLFDKGDAILKALKEANVKTDENKETKDNQWYHYCTGLKKVGENCDKTWDYDGYTKEYINALKENLEIFQKDIESPNKSNCKEALNKLGLMIHMWQDYYSHGVKDDGWAIGDEGSIEGTPDNPEMRPSSYGLWGCRGGHGGVFRFLNPFSNVEPGDRAEDSEDRKQKAVDFVREKLLNLLPKWAGACCCEWENN